MAEYINQVIVLDSGKLQKVGETDAVEIGGDFTAGNLSTEGDLSAANGTFSADVSAVNATLSGDISAVGATLSADLAAVNATLSGDLSAVGGTFSADIGAVNATLSGDLSAVGATLSADLAAVNATLSGDLSAVGATLSADLAAVNATLSGDLSAVGGTFSADIGAVNATLSGDLSAVGATLSADLSAVNATLSGDMDAVNATLSGDLSAVGGTFSADIGAVNATLSGDLSAVGATLSADLAAVNATLSGDLSAVGGTFSADIGAVNATLSGDLSAVNATLSGDMSAVGGTFSGDIAAVNATLSGNLEAVDGTFSGALSAAATTLSSLDVSGNAAIGGNLVVTGDIVSRGTVDLVVQDNFIDLNIGNASEALLPGGWTVSMKMADGFTPIAVSEFTAGSEGVEAPTFAIAPADAEMFIAADIVQISGSSDGSNDGLFVVDSVDAETGIVTIKGIGGTLSTVPFIQNQFTAAADQSAQAFKVDLAAFAANDGVLNDQVNAGILVYQYAPSASEDLFVAGQWKSVGSDGVSLQNAYDNGSDITLSALKGPFSIYPPSGEDTQSVSIEANAASMMKIWGAALDIGATGIDGEGWLSQATFAEDGSISMTGSQQSYLRAKDAAVEIKSVDAEDPDNHNYASLRLAADGMADLRSEGEMNLSSESGHIRAVAVVDEVEVARMKLNHGDSSAELYAAGTASIHGTDTYALIEAAGAFKVADFNAENPIDLLIVSAAEAKTTIKQKTAFEMEAGYDITAEAGVAKGEVLCYTTDGTYDKKSNTQTPEVVGVATDVAGAQTMHSVFGLPVAVKFKTGEAPTMAGVPVYLSSTAGQATITAPTSTGRVYRLGVTIAGSADGEGLYKILWMPAFVADL
jgi:putative sterol carrier protein